MSVLISLQKIQQTQKKCWQNIFRLLIFFIVLQSSLVIASIKKSEWWALDPADAIDRGLIPVLNYPGSNPKHKNSNAEKSTDNLTKPLLVSADPYTLCSYIENQLNVLYPPDFQSGFKYFKVNEQTTQFQLSSGAITIATLVVCEIEQHFETGIPVHLFNYWGLQQNAVDKVRSCKKMLPNNKFWRRFFTCGACAFGKMNVAAARCVNYLATQSQTCNIGSTVEISKVVKEPSATGIATPAEYSASAQNLVTAYDRNGLTVTIDNSNPSTHLILESALELLLNSSATAINIYNELLVLTEKKHSNVTIKIRKQRGLGNGYDDKKQIVYYDPTPLKNTFWGINGRPEINLGHELIHAYQHFSAQGSVSRLSAEWQTVGIKPGSKYTENQIRDDYCHKGLGVVERSRYASYEWEKSHQAEGIAWRTLF